MFIRPRMYLIIRLIIMDTLRPGLHLQPLWQLVYIVAIITTMVVIMEAVMVEGIRLSLITETVLIITITPETHPTLYVTIRIGAIMAMAQ